MSLRTHSSPHGGAWPGVGRIRSSVWGIGRPQLPTCGKRPAARSWWSPVPRTASGGADPFRGQVCLDRRGRVRQPQADALAGQAPLLQGYRQSGRPGVDLPARSGPPVRADEQDPVTDDAILRTLPAAA